jgi:hypothetical protein
MNFDMMPARLGDVRTVVPATLPCAFVEPNATCGL